MAEVVNWTPVRFANGVTTGSSHDPSKVEARFGAGSRLIAELSNFDPSKHTGVESVMNERNKTSSDYAGMDLVVGRGSDVGLKFVHDSPDQPQTVVGSKPLSTLGIVVAVPNADTTSV